MRFPTILFVQIFHRQNSYKSKCASYLQFSLWLTPNSMRKGAWRGEGEGSDLENLCIELSPSVLPLPPVLCSLINYCWKSGDHQWLATARQTWFGGWRAGNGRLKGWRGEEGKGKESSACAKGFDPNTALRKAKWNRTPRYKWPLHSFIYLWEWKIPRTEHVSRQLWP